MRRRRRRMKRRPMRKMRYRRKVARMSMRPEVKHVDVVAVDVPISIGDPAAPQDSMILGAGSGNKLVTDILSTIIQGVMASQRVGAQIFVKSINTRMVCRWCPNSTYLAASYGQSIPGSGSIGVRLVWANNGELTNSVNFFASLPTSAARWSADLKRVDRRKYTVWSDKTYRRSIGSDGATSLGTVANANTLLGVFMPAITINHTLKVNKRIIYNSGSTSPKDSECIFTLNAFAVPSNLGNISTGTVNNELMKQVYCANFNIRVYYTDV